MCVQFGGMLRGRFSVSRQGHGDVSCMSRQGHQGASLQCLAEFTWMTDCLTDALPGFGEVFWGRFSVSRQGHGDVSCMSRQGLQGASPQCLAYFTRVTACLTDALPGFGEVLWGGKASRDSAFRLMWLGLSGDAVFVRRVQARKRSSPRMNARESGIDVPRVRSSV